MFFQKNKKFIFLLLMTVVILLVLFQKISIITVISTIRTADIKVILLALGVSIISNIVISSYRWKLILMKLNCSISFKESLLIKIGSDSIVSALPLKIGESFRVLYLKHVQRMSYHKSVASIAAEYLLNAFALLFFIFIGSIFYWSTKGEFVLHKSCLLGPILYFNFCLNSKKNSWITKCKKHFYEYFRNPVGYFKKILFDRNILLFTFLLNFSELFNVYLVLKSIDVFIPLYAILLFMPLVIFIENIPITFLGLGLRESAVLFFFLKYASAEKLMSVGILYSFVGHITPMIIGLSLTGLFMHKLTFHYKNNVF